MPPAKMLAYDRVQIFQFGHGTDWVATRDVDEAIKWYCEEYGFDDADDAGFDPEPVDLMKIHFIEGADHEAGEETLLEAVKSQIQRGHPFPVIISSENY